MDQTLFPRTTVGGVSVSRMIIGTNWILGWSHTGAAADATIHERNHNREVVADLLEVFLARGVDTIMGPLSSQPLILDAMKLAEDRTGLGLIRIDTPFVNVDDSPAARREADAAIALSRRESSTFCLLHHAVALLIDRCLTGMQVNEERTAHWLEQSFAIATAVSPYLGYHAVSELAREAQARGITFRALLLEKALFTPEELATITAAYELTTPGVAGEKAMGKGIRVKVEG